MKQAPAIFALLLGTLLCTGAAGAARAQDSTQTILHLLDYIAVDYPEAVENGEIRNAAEFDEMREFAGNVQLLLNTLPASEPQPGLAETARRLAGRIEARAPPEEIAQLANGLRASIVSAFGIRTAPGSIPDLQRASTLYASHCASCHGLEGRGDGPAGAALEPAPTNFLDTQRSAQRSPYGLYSTITLGVEGTGMRPFTELSEADRWALAFFVGNLAVDGRLRARGEVLWSEDEAREQFPDLASIAGLSAQEVRNRYGEDGVAVHAFLRTHPDVLSGDEPRPLQVAIATLDESLEAYRRDDVTGATRLAVEAYLEGFELVEASLRSLDADLVVRIEREMMAYRALLQSRAPLEQVENEAQTVRALLHGAQAKLGGDRVTAAATFASALVILLREGAEAILVIAAILAFLARANRPDARRWVHAGWLAALALGVVTWFVSNYVIGISGASRELTEGITALFSAALLLYVGYWLHSKAYGEAWQKFIRHKVGSALSKGGTQLLAIVSFLAVYREVFETVLFYQALSAQSAEGTTHALAGGFVVGAILLVGVCWAILRASVKLPINVFFAVSGFALVVLAVIFTGQGIAALQEAGKIGVTSLPSFSLPIFGVQPTLQTLAAQCLVIAIVAGGYWWTHRTAKLSRSSAGKH